MQSAEETMERKVIASLISIVEKETTAPASAVKAWRGKDLASPDERRLMKATLFAVLANDSKIPAATLEMWKMAPVLAVAYAAEGEL
jgi:hypothetical protein